MKEHLRFTGMVAVAVIALSPLRQSHADAAPQQTLQRPTGSAASPRRIQPPGAAMTLPTIPLCAGLTLVTAVAQPNGDYESLKTVESLSSTEVHLRYSAEMKNTDLLDPGPPLKQINLERTILAADMHGAHAYQQYFLEQSAERIPETTSIGVSAAVLRELKTQGTAELSISNAYPGLQLSADRNKFPNYYQYLQKGTLHRLGGSDATVSVLVNDVPVDLPAVHAEADFVGDKAEFFFLDDERNPLTLAFRIGIGGIKPLVPEARQFCETLRKGGKGTHFQIPGGLHCDQPDGGDRDTLRVVKITYHCSAPPAGPATQPGTGTSQAPAGGGDLGGGISPLEQALQTQRKADVYSIYFSFNSAAIRAESEPTLAEIGRILRSHPDWRLAVNGHTDSIGGDPSNLELSQRRAAAVKDALVSRYGIPASRLSTAGLGRAQPKDTNDTLEGRARNRRVELVRS